MLLKFFSGFLFISLIVHVLCCHLLIFSSGRSRYAWNNLPAPEDFSKALYTFDIGQNDLDAGFKSMTEKQVIESIPGIIGQLAQAVQVFKRALVYAFWEALLYC